MEIVAMLLSIISCIILKEEIEMRKGKKLLTKLFLLREKNRLSKKDYAFLNKMQTKYPQKCLNFLETLNIENVKNNTRNTLFSQQDLQIVEEYIKTILE